MKPVCWSCWKLNLEIRLAIRDILKMGDPRLLLLLSLTLVGGCSTIRVERTRGAGLLDA